MQRIVTAELDLELGASIDLIFQITAAQHVPVISEALGHDSEDTTRIYLALLDSSVVDKANSKVIRSIGR